MLKGNEFTESIVVFTADFTIYAKVHKLHFVVNIFAAMCAWIKAANLRGTRSDERKCEVNLLVDSQ